MELSETIKKLKDYKLHGYNKFFLKNNMDRVATKLEIEEMLDTAIKALEEYEDYLDTEIH